MSQDRERHDARELDGLTRWIYGGTPPPDDPDTGAATPSPPATDHRRHRN